MWGVQCEDCRAGGSQVRFEDVVEAMTRAFDRWGCGLIGFLKAGEEDLVVQWKMRETKRASRRGLRVKERRRWVRPCLSIVIITWMRYEICIDIDKTRMRRERNIKIRRMEDPEIYIFVADN